MIDFQSVFIDFHIFFNVEKTIGRSMHVKKLEVASLAFDESAFYDIGTRFGTNVKPYSKYGLAYDTKNLNPFLMTKDTGPYLNLTRDSGVNIRPVDIKYEHGIYIPINNDKSPSYELGGFRFWYRWEYLAFPTFQIKVLELKFGNVICDGYIVPTEDPERAKFLLVDRVAHTLYPDVAFFVGAQTVVEPYLQAGLWNSIQVVFDRNIENIGKHGSLSLLPGPIWQNIATFENSNESVDYYKSTKLWQDVKNQNPLWSDVDDETWAQITKGNKVANYFVNIQSVHKSILGTESLVSADDNILTFPNSGLTYYSDLGFETYTLKAGNPVTVR
jgi:hypothetical protein